MDELILAGDIGGTKTNLACFSPAQGLDRPLHPETYHSPDFKDLESLITQFLATRPSGRIAAACFGVAGPVEQGRVKTTNIPWDIIDEETLKAHLGTPKVALLNDIMAMAHGLSVLSPASLHTINAGETPAVGNGALLAAGTGLGEAMLHWDGRRWHPSPSEGGHADFAPANELEAELWRYLHRRHGRVSFEQVLSGPGMVNIYQFLRDTGREDEPGWLAERLAREDPGAVISETALARGCALSEKTIELFVHLYGNEAGNMALKGLALGGVYLGGGIAPKILPFLRGEIFMDGFAKGRRLEHLLEKIPVRVMLDPRSPLFGAAFFASLL